VGVDGTEGVDDVEAVVDGVEVFYKYDKSIFDHDLGDTEGPYYREICSSGKIDASSRTCGESINQPF
jgi:hypothetical protein